MNAFHVKDIKESNRIKKEICENCKEALKGVFSDDQLKKFEDCFMVLLQMQFWRGGKRNEEHTGTAL